MNLVPDYSWWVIHQKSPTESSRVSLAPGPMSSYYDPVTRIGGNGAITFKTYTSVQLGLAMATGEISREVRGYLTLEDSLHSLDSGVFDLRDEPSFIYCSSVQTPWSLRGGVLAVLVGDVRQTTNEFGPVSP